MSSPCKKIKLTPKKQRDGQNKKYSQESKVTSTPQRHSRNTVSPNISSICSSDSNAKSHLSDIFDSGNEASTSSPVSELSCTLNKAESEKSEIIAVEDYDAYINEFEKIKYFGKVWKLYKPLNDNSLYAHILEDPRNVQEVVTELLLLYNNKPESAILKLLKLCVDVSGYQSFEVSDFYNFQDNIAKRVIEIMESNKVLEQQEFLIDTKRYLFMEPRTNLVKILKVSIYNFIQKLVISAHERGILYDDFFAKHFFVFVKSMSFSQLRPIRHTGVIFGIKILTALVIVYSKIIDEDECSSSRSDDRFQLQKQEVNNYLEYMYFIFTKNCRLQEHQIILMRVDCIYELSIWIRYFPKIFISQLQTVNYLIKLTTDPSKEVRLASLETFEALITTPSTLTVLKNAIPDFPEHIGKRFYDVDPKVAIKAIDIYGLFLKHDNSLISTNRFKMLMSLVCDKYFPIGEAACRFLICYLEQTETNHEILLLLLAKFAMKRAYAVKQMIVEGCLHNWSIIKNWKLYINILLDNDVELDVRESLTELFAETVHQVSTGSATIMREKSKKVLMDPAEHMSVAKYFSKFPPLLEQYKDCPIILTELLKIVCTVNESVLSNTPLKTFHDIFLIIEKLLYYQEDGKLLKKLCETLYYFSITSLKTHTEGIVEKISSSYSNSLISSLSDKSEETTKIVLKISLLFEYFDLSKKVQWETLFDSWGEVDETTTIHLLSCCKWYLIWSLKNVISIESPLTQFPILTRACREFISTCFNMLQNLKGEELHFKVYECLCDLHITFMKDLEALNNSVVQIQQLKLVIEDKQLQNVLNTFLEKFVIANETISLAERRTYVVKYMDMVHLHVLPVECLAHIFKYYYVYNREYGPMIDSSLSSIAASDENTLLLVVLYTLTVCYEEILNKCNVIDMTTMETKSLKLLIKQFLNFKEFKSQNKKFTKLIYFTINYSFKDESKYPFLYFVRYFVDLTVNEDKKDILEFFKEKLPQGAEKIDSVLYFANYLKNKKPAVGSQKSKPKVVSRPSKENKKPKKKAEQVRKRGTPRSIKNKENTREKGTEKVRAQRDTETEVSEDDLTIHDSESDDLEETMSGLRI